MLISSSIDTSHQLSAVSNLNEQRFTLQENATHHLVRTYYDNNIYSF